MNIVLFIALHMISVRIRPEAPTRQPETTSTVLLIAKPANAAARPEKALSREITTGMSPPPTGITSVRPRTRYATETTTMPASSAFAPDGAA